MAYANSNVPVRGWLLASAAVLSSASAEAQVAAPAAPATTPQTAETAETDDQRPDGDIVVTGTSAARRARDTPLSVSTIDATQLQRTAASSQADILNTVPSIKAEGGGGEVLIP